MEDNKKAAIGKIYLLTKQDGEFNEELRKKLGIASSASSALIDDDRLNQIYEYCIEEIIRKQAEDFYKEFPVTSIVSTLIDDYVRMESFRIHQKMTMLSWIPKKWRPLWKGLAAILRKDLLSMAPR